MKPQSILIIIVIIALFYFLFIVPQRRQQKGRQTMMAQLGPGAKVLTSGGIYGQVLSIHGDVLLVRIAPEVEIELDQRAVMRVVEAAPAGGWTDADNGDETYSQSESSETASDFGRDAATSDGEPSPLGSAMGPEETPENPHIVGRQ